MRNEWYPTTSYYGQHLPNGAKSHGMWQDKVDVSLTIILQIALESYYFGVETDTSEAFRALMACHCRLLLANDDLNGRCIPQRT